MTASVAESPMQHSDAVAGEVLRAYAALPVRGKPRRRDNGVNEWTVLAGICLVRDSEDGKSVRCISLGTGLKALPHSKLPAHGDVLHDSHAEVIARRGFHLWLYAQLERELVCERAKGRGRELDAPLFLERDLAGCWRLKSEYKVAFYISTLPCGDASTYLLAQAAGVGETASTLVAPIKRELEGASPDPGTALDDRAASALRVAAALGLSTAHDSNQDRAGGDAPAAIVHRGRVSYSSVSCLRTKPGRADSPPTTSHSCSDKLAVWSLVGLQGALLSQLGVRRIAIDELVVGGVAEQLQPRVEEEVRRAVGGRLEDWARARGIAENDFCPPHISFTTHVFAHARDEVAQQAQCDEADVASCQTSLSYVADLAETTEIIVNGMRHSAPSRRKEGEPLGPKARSRLCKLSLFQRFEAVREGSEPTSYGEVNPRQHRRLSYYARKHLYGADALQASAAHSDAEYQRLKSALRAEGSGPFAGWLVSGEPYEQFDSLGHVLN